MIDKAVKEAYMAQKRGCRGKLDRNGDPVEMNMSLQQFADKWDQSCKWHLRGAGRGKYCMARHNDIGHYEWDNVSIIPFEENVRQAHAGKINSEETIKKRVATRAKNNKPSPLKGKPGKAVFTAETIEKMRAAKLGKRKAQA